MEQIKLISLQGLKTFLDKIQAWVLEKLGVLDKKIDKQIFQGTEEELAIAIQQGLVDENTLIILDTGTEQPVYELCEYADIRALFPELNIA